ncbi:MAG: B-box zinc finger protein [Promethearchaeota archaeon]
MKCAVHQDQEAIAVCRSCGNALCANCRITITGIAYCQPCLDAGRYRPPTQIEATLEDRLPTPLGPVTTSSRRNFLIGLLGMVLVAVFIHAQWVCSLNFNLYSPLNLAMFIPRSVGAVLVAVGIALSAFAWNEMRPYFNFRWALYISLFTILTPWWGIIAESLIYSGQVIVETPPYGYLGLGPLSLIFNYLVIVSSVFFGILMIVWAFALLYVRKHSRSPKLTLGTAIVYIILAHMTLLIIPIFLQQLVFYPYSVMFLMYGGYSILPSIIIEIGVILNAIFFWRLAASLKPY